MAEREKVIKGMELCKQDAKLCFSETECPYQCEFPRCCLKLMADALELLKEQKAKKGHWIVLEFCANEGIYCSECHMKIFDRTTKPKKKLSQYCPHCGSRNDQFFRDGEVVFR